MKLAARLINRLLPRSPARVESLELWLKQQRIESVTLCGRRMGAEVGGFGRVPPHDDSASITLPELPPRVLAKLRGCKIRGRDGYVILPDGSYLMENTNEKWLLGNPAYFQRFQPIPRKLSGDWFSLLSMHCREHYHWLHDSLTLLHGVLEHLPEDCRFLIPDRLSCEKVAILDGFGIPSERVVRYNPDDPVSPDVLHLATPAAPHLQDDPVAIAWLRAKLHAYFNLDPKPVRRFFISRQNAATRRIANMAEITPILEKHGFEIVQPEQMTLREQASLFSEAAMIAGPHGAAHTNMLFSHSDCAILDVFAGEIGFRTYYASLAAAIGMRYQPLIAVPLEPAYDAAEMTVDPVSLGDCFAIA